MARTIRQRDLARNGYRYSAHDTARIFGDGIFACSIYEIAKCLNTSPEQIRRIERRAMHKARQWCRDHGYALEDLLPEGRARENPYEMRP